MTRAFDEDPMGAVLEYGLLLEDPSRQRERREWEQKNLERSMPEVWQPRAITKSHLIEILGGGAKEATLRQRLHRIFRQAEQCHLIEPLWEDDDPASPRRRVVLTWEEVQSKMYLEIVLGLPYIAQRWSHSVVCIYAPQGEGVGTGFLVSSDTVVTARHVVDDTPGFKLSVRRYPGLVMLEPDQQPPTPDPRIIPCGKPIFHPDNQVDMALVPLSVPVTWIEPMRLSKAPPGILDDVVILGYPPVPLTREAILVANKGEVSAVTQLYYGGRAIIMTSQLRGGYSGGPVLNERGEAVGVVSKNLVQQISPEKGGIDERLGFAAATPIDYVRQLLHKDEMETISW